MSISDEELARQVKETSARVEAAIAAWNQTRRKAEQVQARTHTTAADLEARLAKLPAALREYVLAQGEKFARQDITAKAPPPKPAKKVPRSMV